VRSLEWATPPEWVERVESELPALLSDHAHCELKAAATAQALVAKNTEDRELVEQLAAMAGEELEHFQRVTCELYSRGATLRPQEPSPYAAALRSRSAATRSSLLLDRLLLAQLIEARSLERFQLLAEHLADRELSALYRDLMASEAGHRALFGRLARGHFPAPIVERRQAALWALEGEILAALPFAHRMHSGLGPAGS
jgi:tRNA-(ms[2]io[6]A)-hydroxylase